MEDSLLASHKSRKRKRDDDDELEVSPAKTLTSLCCDITAYGNSIQDEANVEGNSPRGVVAGRLRDLDIRTTFNSGVSLSTKHDVGDRYKEEVSEDAKDEIQPVKSPKELTEATTLNDSEGRLEEGNSGQTESLSNGSSSPATTKVEKQQLKPTRYKPPPLEEDFDEGSLTWQESEITGYDATDPNDDGYGLDGVGFKPSATVAWDRAQRRKKQIAEWNQRESREARNRRRERRDGIAADPDHPHNTPNQKRVKFDI